MTFSLTDVQRAELTRLARRGTIQHRIARRANALVLLDRGWSCTEVADAFLIDDDTVRSWSKVYIEQGLAGLERFEAGGSACDMADDQITALVEWVDRTLPASTRMVGAWIRKTFGLSYTRSGLIKLLGRAGLVWHKPSRVARSVDPQAQRAFIRNYEKLLNALGDDEAVMFIDAVHPAHQARPAGCWAKRNGPPLAVASNSGRENLNVHGAIDLSTGKTVIIEATRIDETTTIDLLGRIESRNPALRRIVVFADHAAYHKSKAVAAWLNRPECRIDLRFVPVYCPHLNPIERLWGVMHKNITHNRCYASQREFCQTVLAFLRETVPKHFHRFRSRITDNFRVIDHSEIRVLT